jgi:thioredoxin reductase (NADPH)
VVGLDVAGSTRLVRFNDGTSIAAHAVVLATGVSYRRLTAPGCDDLTNRGVYYGSAATEAPACAGEDVYIVGGANSAGQAAMYFARYARAVHILIRGGDLRRSMSQYLIDQIAANERITVHPQTEVCSAEGDDHLQRLVLRDVATGQTRDVDASWMFVFIGAEPCTEWLGDTLSRDRLGFILTGPDLLIEGRRPPRWIPPRDPFHLEASVPGVFAAGDVRATSVKRVASAVGEGAMAVSLVHRYLESS